MINKVEQITNEMFRFSDHVNDFFVRIINYKTYEEQLEEVSWTKYLFEQGPL
ncbi:hypothetical protein [Jeotgalibacillus soli]|uniref:Protein kinase n=1 Tax=Jeotgalibacillus soli TaxID=889306 RepID=A0A0C2V6M2_9BACL|nr:hypothetical protein [Jeotgalibacillus soli]KIL44612.1 protein kinase [Jeotgalibacillus soli]